MNEDLKTTEFLFAKIKKLYPTFTRPDEIDIRAWTEILAGYSQTDILEALKNYRKNVPYNNAPLPASFKDYLPVKHIKAETKVVKELPTPESLMTADREDGDLRHFLWDYKAAYKLCTEDWLAEVLPADEYNYAVHHYPRNVKLALENGVLNRFSEALRKVSLERYGREYAYLSNNDIKAQKENNTYHPQRYDTQAQNDGEYKNTPQVGTLAAHWGV